MADAHDGLESDPAGGTDDDPDLTSFELEGLSGIDLESRSLADGDKAAKQSPRAESSSSKAEFEKTVIPGLLDSQRYRFAGEFARGGMGRIILAFDRATGREVAIKELIGKESAAADTDAASACGGDAGRGGTKASSGSGATPPDEITLERFLREARITSRLEHPNIVPVYEIAERRDGVWYYSMKFVRGVTLARKLKDIARDSKLDVKGKRDERQKLLRSLVEVCNAIAYADSKGVVHRDLKPDNIMLGEFGETVILDWGLSRVEGESVATASQILNSRVFQTRKSKSNASDSTGRSSSRLTMDGSILGTPGYMPPEQALGKLEEVDHCSDVYSLGAILYEILAGERAYPGEDAFEVIESVIEGPPKALAEVAPDIPPELVAVTEKAMARDKASRFSTARQLGSEIEAWLNGNAVASYRYSTREQLRRLVKRHKAVVGTAAAALMLLLVGGAVAVWSISQEKQEAENARVVAETVSGELVAEKQAREKLQQEEADRWRVGRIARRAQYDQIVAEVERDQPLAPRLADAERMHAAWLAAGKPEPEAETRRQQEQVILAVNSSVGQLERALSLAIQPLEDRSPQLFAADNPKGDEMLIKLEQDRLNAAKLAVVRLSAANGDYALARYLLGWAVATGLADSVRAEEGRAIFEAEGALLEKRRERILFALDDVRQGLSRTSRPFNGKRLDDYVFELVQYKDQQTAELLGEALLEMATKAGWTEGTSVTATVPLEVRWTTQEVDVAKLCSRVLGRLGLGDAAVAALTPLSTVVLDHALIVEVGHALGNSGSVKAWAPLNAMQQRFGLNSDIVDAAMITCRNLPIPELGPDATAEDWIIRGRNRESMGDIHGAIADYNQATDLDENDARGYNNRGNCLMDLRDFEGALRDYTKSLELDPEEPGASRTRSNMGLAFRALRLIPEALEQFDLAIAGDPTLARAYVNRAQTYASMGRYSLAIKDCRDAIRVDESNSIAMHVLALVYAQTDNLPEALHYANQLVRLKYNGSDSYSLRGYIMTSMRDSEGAIRDLERALELNPANYHAHMNMGAALRNLNRLSDALKAFQNAVDHAPGDKWVLEHLTDHQELMEFEKWLTRNASSSMEHFTKCMAHAEFAHFTDSQANLAAADAACLSGLSGLGAQPSDDLKKAAKRAIDLLMTAYVREKMYPMAVEWAERLLELPQFQPANPDVAAGAAMSAAQQAAVLATAGDADAAKWVDRTFALLERAIELGYANEIAAEESHKLVAIRSDERWAGMLSRIQANAKLAEEQKKQAPASE